MGQGCAGRALRREPREVAGDLDVEVGRGCAALRREPREVAGDLDVEVGRGCAGGRSGRGDRSGWNPNGAGYWVSTSRNRVTVKHKVMPPGENAEMQERDVVVPQ